LRDRGSTGAPAEPINERPVWFTDRFVTTPVFRRMTLVPGQTIEGPAIIEEPESTLVVRPEFALVVDTALNLILTKSP
jgi:N-methylhydantoinase A